MWPWNKPYIRCRWCEDPLTKKQYRERLQKLHPHLLKREHKEMLKWQMEGSYFVCEGKCETEYYAKMKDDCNKRAKEMKKSD